MARRTKEDALVTRNRILDAAEHVFFDKGVAHTSLADIAQQAGVTRGAIYWHFENKVDLFGAMLERVLLPIDELLKMPSDTPPPDPLGKMRGILTWCLHGVARDPQVRRVFGIVYLKCGYVADMEPLFERRRADIGMALANIETDLRHAVVRGQLPADLDTARAALMVHAFLNGVLRDMLILPELVTADADADATVDACFDMLKLSPALRRKR
jgi:TetR/AcrR family acrAB operon transcriptional repressor